VSKNNQIKISLRQKIALIIFGLFLTLIILETGLRLGGFIILSLQERRNLLSIKQRGEYRIICLGESTTQGQYPSYLEAVLNQRNIGIKFSVIDKGIAGTNTGFIVSQLEANLDKYQPDLVVTMMGINDYEVHISYEAGSANQITLFFKSFRTYKLARLLWLHIITKAKEMGFYKPQKNNWFIKRFEHNLQETRLKAAYTKEDNLIQQETSFKKALELNPQNDQAYTGLGWLYINQGKLIEAEQAFKKALELNPSSDQAFVGLGLLYLRQGKFIEAEQAFKKALELNPQNEWADVKLGWLYLSQVKHAEAEQAFKKALELNPRNDWADVGLGWLYNSQGKLIEAEQAFKKALELNPQNDLAYTGLGRIYNSQGKLIEAEQAFKKALELNPRNDRVYGSLAVVYGEMGNYILRREYEGKAKQIREGFYNPIIINNYRRFKQILNRRKTGWICVQYPICSIEPLKKIFEGEEGIFFVDNEEIFKSAVLREGYKKYFRDIFAGDFGHCTEKGNRLLAENIADVILKEVFKK